MTNGEYLGAGSGVTKLLLHLNGNSVDSSGNGNNGTNTAITYSQANGKFGQGAGFNGSSSCIKLETAGTSMSFSGDFTLSAWVKKNSGTMEIISKATSNGATSNNYEWVLSNTGMNLYGVLGKISSITYTFTADIWYHLVAVKTSIRTVVFYVNGVGYDGTLSHADLTFNTNTTPPYIGRRDDGAGYGYFNGEMDEVIAENRAWTASEVKKYYTYAKGRFGII